MRFMLSFLTFLSLLVESAPASLISEKAISAHLSSYPEKHVILIKKDLAHIKTLVFDGIYSASKPFYIGTAGGPGACKSTILETILRNDDTFDNAVYIDPDSRALRFMPHTYLARSLSFYTISKISSFEATQKKAYDYWREGSTYIAKTLLNTAADGHFNIAHGTTSTSSYVPKLYEQLKKKGYKITLVLCYAEDDTREAFLHHRKKVQANYQASPEDTLIKGKIFPTRFPLYFKYADRLILYWSYDLEKWSRQVAVFEKGKLTITNHKGYKLFVQKYETDRNAAKEPLPSWEELLKS